MVEHTFDELRWRCVLNLPKSGGDRDHNGDVIFCCHGKSVQVCNPSVVYEPLYHDPARKERHITRPPTPQAVDGGARPMNVQFRHRQLGDVRDVNLLFFSFF